MRQAKAARAIEMSQREFVETYGNIDYVPREADLAPPVVQHTVQNLRNELETKDMNPILKWVGLKVFDSVFSNKTTKGIQKWADMEFYWKSFADLFKSKGKRIMGRQKPGFATTPRKRMVTDPRDEADAIQRSRRFKAMQQQKESVLRDFVRETLEEKKKKKKKRKKKKKTGVGWGNPAGPGVSDPGGIAGPGM